MTLSEYRLVLTTLTPAQRATFAEWEEAVESVEGNLAALATAPDRERYERGAVFHLIEGHGFRYPAYRDRILDAVRQRYYALPRWLPSGACYFCDRYFPERSCHR